MRADGGGMDLWSAPSALDDLDEADLDDPRRAQVVLAGRRAVVWGYELSMIALAMLSVWLMFAPTGYHWVHEAHLALWAVFTIDYGVRFLHAPDRRRFLKANVLDLIAILPVDLLRAGRLAHLARLARLTRLGLIAWRSTSGLRTLLRSHHLGHVLLATGVIVAVGAAVISSIEPQFADYGDGLWWSLVTVTTVGYGDVSPTTGIGRILAGCLMLGGIGVMALTTGTVASYFLQARSGGNPQIDFIRTELDRWNGLAPAEKQRVAAMLHAVAALESRGVEPAAGERLERPAAPPSAEGAPQPDRSSASAPSKS